MHHTAVATGGYQSTDKINLIVQPQQKRWKQMFYRPRRSILVRMRAVKIQKNID